MNTILIVEDNAEIRNEISDIFKMEDYNVIEASNGLNGYLKATNNLPDIIISDIMMPVMDGYKMFNELKNNSLTDQIPIIFLSALSADHDIRKGMNLGAEDYLTKPVDSDNLIKAAKNKIEKHSKFDKRFNETKINITNMLYHELNTPLNGIIGFSDYLRRRAEELSKNDIKKVANSIYTSGQRLNKLADKYLTYSKLKINSINLSEIKKMKDCEFISVNPTVSEVVNENNFFERKNDIVIKSENVKLKIKKEFFKRLIFELFENAVKFSSIGGKIILKSFVENNVFVIQIKNEGRGLSKEQIMELNDFTQFNTDKYAQNGSGIGLAIVNFIADIYGAELDFESIPNNYFSVQVKFRQFIKNDDKLNVVQNNKDDFVFYK